MYISCYVVNSELSQLSIYMHVLDFSNQGKGWGGGGVYTPDINKHLYFKSS